MPHRLPDTSLGSPLPTRREVLSRLGGGFGGLALAALLGEARGETAALPERFDVLPRPPHAPARAKAVIQLFMHGGPSHVDLLDPKPMLAKYDGKPPPAEVADDEKLTGNLLKSPFQFAQARPVRPGVLRDAAAHRPPRRRHRRGPLDVHRASQPRAGAAG